MQVREFPLLLFLPPRKARRYDKFQKDSISIPECLGLGRRENNERFYEILALWFFVCFILLRVSFPSILVHRNHPMRYCL